MVGEWATVLGDQITTMSEQSTGKKSVIHLEIPYDAMFEI